VLLATFGHWEGDTRAENNKFEGQIGAGAQR
jgi:hypothetical protein